MSYGKNYRPDVRPCPRLPRGCGFTHGRIFTIRGRGKNRVRVDIGPSTRTRSSPCPHPPSRPPRSPCADGLLRPSGLEKRGKKCSVFNPQDPQDPRDPQVPRAPWASRAKPREEEGFFDLVPLVTHPSSIPLLGGLTPKFLSLSFHSVQSLLMLMASRVGTLWSLRNLIDLELNLCSIESNEGVTTNIIIIAP
jgi:hypothetical protein